ncbi:MAG: hypothetical protein SGILL_003865 [Bacillariaceae sp.]
MTVIVDTEKPMEDTPASTMVLAEKEKEHKEGEEASPPAKLEVTNAAAIEAPLVLAKEPQLGTRIAKNFPFFGDITEVWTDKKSNKWAHIVYDDGDEEDILLSEAEACMILYEKKKDQDTKRRAKKSAAKRGGKAPVVHRRVSPYPKRG